MDASKLIDHFCPVVPSVSPAAIAALPSVNCLLGGTCSHLLPAGPGGQNTLVVDWPSAGCRQETGPQISIYPLYSLSRDLCSVERTRSRCQGNTAHNWICYYWHQYSLPAGFI